MSVLGKIKELLLFTALALIICVSACKKSPTIWGTWGESSLMRVYSRNGTVTSADTNYYDTTGSAGPVFTFTTAGTYFSTYSNGKYTLTNKMLTLLDTTNVPNQTTQFNVLTLDYNLLVLGHIDTNSLSPLTTVQYTYTCVPK